MQQDKMVSFRKSLSENLGKVLLYLTACAINEIVPDKEVYTSVSAGLLYAGAKTHTIESMIASALERTGYDGIDPDIVKRFRTGKDKAVRKNVLLNTERRIILDYMEREKIKYLPLKGIILQELYPELGMRQMADNDILYDAKYQMKLKDFMISRGFHAKYVGLGVHDCYYKQPVYNFEMHTRLFEETLNDGKENAYYEDVWSMAVRDNDKEYGYHFSDEDVYVYVTAHAAKHHEGSGTGIRTLADIYMMNRAYAGADREYINAELERLGLSDFEKKLRLLAEKLFADPGRTIDIFDSLSTKEAEELRYILTSGTYGTKEQGVVSRMKNLTGKSGKATIGIKLKYYVKRTFPGQKVLRPYYPPARFKVLVPLVWVFRILRGVTIRAKRVFGEIRIVRRQKEI